MIKWLLKLVAWALVTVLALELAGCESVGSGRKDDAIDGYYGDNYWHDSHYRYNCCYNRRAVVRPPHHRSPGSRSPGHRPLPAAPPPPPPPP